MLEEEEEKVKQQVFFVFTDGSHICGLQDQLIAQGGTTAFVFQIKRYLSEKSRFSAVIS